MKDTTTFRNAMLAMAPLMFATPALADDPRVAPENTWVSVSGEVTSVSPATFELAYDAGRITVEMDEWNQSGEAYKLVEGDKVTVTGIIDGSLFENRELDANSVYVDSINTYFYADPYDEAEVEIDTNFVTMTSPVTDAPTVLQGTVTGITGDNEFVIQTGAMRVLVETDEMDQNPLDEEGHQKIEVGDRVSVAGEFDDDFFEGTELVADTIITLSDL